MIIRCVYENRNKLQTTYSILIPTRNTRCLMSYSGLASIESKTVTHLHQNYITKQSNKRLQTNAKKQLVFGR